MQAINRGQQVAVTEHSVIENEITLKIGDDTFITLTVKDLKWLQAHIRESMEFEQWVKRMEQMSDEEIDSWVD